MGSWRREFREIVLILREEGQEDHTLEELKKFILKKKRSYFLTKETQKFSFSLVDDNNKPTKTEMLFEAWDGIKWAPIEANSFEEGMVLRSPVNPTCHSSTPEGISARELEGAGSTEVFAQLATERLSQLKFTQKVNKELREQVKGARHQLSLERQRADRLSVRVRELTESLAQERSRNRMILREVEMPSAVEAAPSKRQRVEVVYCEEDVLV